MEQIRNALQCRICLDSINNNCQVSSCCGNLFHHTCAYRVRSTAKRNHQPSLCPTCRAPHFCGDGNNLLKLGWMDDVYHHIASALGETPSTYRMRREPMISATRCLIDPVTVECADPSTRPGLSAASPVCKVHYQFIPLRKEIHKKRMEVYYDPVSDTYHRTQCNVKNQGWRSCVWKYCNIGRKIEESWQMVYLGRENGSDGDRRSYIEWRFNLKEVGLKVKKLKIAVPYITFDSGEVKITLTSRSPNSQIISVGYETDRLHGVKDAHGWDDFVIRVELPGLRNEGASSQLSSQLFRQFLHDVNSGTQNTFRVIIDM